MSELHETFADGLFEARRHPGERSEFHRENKQSPRAEEQKSEAIKINQIKLTLLNMSVLAPEIPVSRHAEKPDSLETKISFLGLIEIILKMIVDGAKAILQKRKEKN